MSRVTPLDKEGQVDELMRMMSGTQRSESARSSAREMLEMAARFKARRARG